jgi:hypothetical protein
MLEAHPYEFVDVLENNTEPHVLGRVKSIVYILVIHPDFSACQNYPKTRTKSTYLDFKWSVTE